MDFFTLGESTDSEVSLMGEREGLCVRSGSSVCVGNKRENGVIEAGLRANSEGGEVEGGERLAKNGPLER